MRFLNWLNRHLGKTEPSHNLQFDSYREDGNAKLELIRLEDRIVLSVGVGLGGVTGDVLELNLDAPTDEATVSVIDGGATIQVDDGLSLPTSIMQLDSTQVSSILVTGTDASQVINFLGQENLVLPGNIDLAGFTGDVNIGIQIQVGPGETPQFNPASAVTYLGQFQLTGDQLNVVLPNEVNADDAFIIQINGPDLEILDPTDLTTPLFSAPTASINSINVFGTDGESDLLTLDYGTAGLTDIAITFNGGSGGNDALEFVGGTFDTITHDLIGPTTGSVDFVDNGITEISYGGLEPVFGVSSTANHIIINLPANTNDAVLENTAVLGEMQIRSLSEAFEFTTFSMPADSLTINTTGGNSLVVFDSFDATFAPTNLILSGTSGDTYQLSGSDLLADSVSLTLSGGATLDLGSFNETIAGLTLEDGSVIATSGVLSLQSGLELRSGTVSADLSGTDLIKNGSGTVILSGTNSFTGSTAVQNGMLQVEGSITTTQVIISSGATLNGSGTVDAPVTVNSGGHLVPGSSPGIISTGDLTLAAGSTLNIEIDGTTAGTEYDQIQVTGTVDVTGATLNLISTFTASAANEFILIDNDGADAVTGTFAGHAEGALLSFNGNQVFISYLGGDGNDVVLTVNSPPAASNQIFAVDENAINTTPVGTIAATDPDLPPDSLTFSVTGDSGQSVFNVSTSGDITVVDQGQLDFENNSSFDLDILVTDSAGATDTATVTINLNPLNDNDPVVMNQIRGVDENATNGTTVGAVIAASDDDLPGDNLTFSEAGGSGAAAFDITSAGQIVVADQSLLNFETNPTYTLDIIVDDNAGGTDTATITINLNDLSETLFVNPSDWSVNDITLVRDGSQLRVLETGTANEIVPSHTFANISSVIITGNGVDNTTRIELSSADITLAGGINFNGGAGSNTLVAPNQTNDWDIDGLNSGSLLSGSVIFSNVENLNGNSNPDTFVMQDNGQITGTINAGGGFDIIDFSADSDVVTVDLTFGSATTVSLGVSLEKIVGDNTQDRITGDTSGTTYQINGVNQGLAVGLVEFEGFSHLIGGATGTDNFQFIGAGQITGSIDGLSGNNVLDYSASTVALDLMLTTTGSTNGFAGSEASTATSFNNINTIIGSSNTDTLTGINTAADWLIDGSNQYSSTNTLDFSGFENLVGGTNIDTFNITGSQTHNLLGNAGNDIFQFQNGATLNGTIDGQSGADRLDYSLVSSSIDAALLANGSFDGFQGTETAISGGFDNITEIIAGSGVADQLTGRDAQATWNIQPASLYGSVTSLAFSNFETLQGGSDIDTFNVNGVHSLNLLGGSGADLFQFSNNGSSINGMLDGQADDDHLNLTNFTTGLSTSLTSLGSTDGFAGTESAKSLTFQNMNQLTGGSGTNSLTGINSQANWTLNGTNSYLSTNTLEFSNFINLHGGTDSDSFDITPDTEAFQVFGGDPTSNPLGDQLNIDTTAAGTALVTSTGVGAGTITGTFPTINYSEIENFAISGVVDVQVDGTTNNDVIEILVVGPNVEYRLGGTLIGSSSLADTNHITVNGGDGDDSLTVDAALAAEGITIDYDGEGQVSTNPGDVLNLLGTTNSVEYIFADLSSGSVRIDGAMTDFIVYTGLEPITSTITVADVTLNYSGVSETITITDAGGGQTTVNSTAGELLTFANPTNSLTINTGAGDDIIDINSLAASFTASLTINGDADTDTINANANISFDTGKLVEFNVETINVATGITITSDGLAFNATEVNLDGDLVSANVSGDATTVNVPGSVGGADLQDAVDVAGTGGIINVAAGSYLTTGTLRVDESVSILGAGKDVVEIRKSGAPGSSFDVAVAISANNVTISGAQLGWEIHTSTTDYRGYVVYTAADNTTLNNLLFSDNYRSAVVFEGANDLEVSDSIFEGLLGRGAIRDGDGESGENFLITRNEFREDHFRWGPIAIGPQGTFSDPNNFAFSGEISFNYFGNGLVTGDFQEAGDQNYTVTITNRGMTTDGIDIFHNSFDWQDSSVTNGDGNFAQPGGIFFDPSLTVPIGTVNITDNIFNGFTYDGPQPAAPTIGPLWRPAGGQFGGALEFDGDDDFGTFQSPLFDVGTAGTLNLWVNMHDQDERSQFFEGLQSKGFEFQFRDNGNGQFFGSPGRDGNSNNYAIQSGNANGTENIWQNLQYTWDFNAPVNPQMHIYIDGVEVAYLSGTFDSDLTQWVNEVSSVNQLITVGKDASSGKYFDGLMDDVGWFNEALDQTDRDDIRMNGVAALAADPRLLAHWDFDQTVGSTVIDNKNGIEITLITGVIPPMFVGGGQFGGALQFDGVEDFATFRDASFDVGKKGTLNFWVKMEDTGRRNQFFEGPDNGGFEFQYRTNGGGQFFGRAQDGSDYTIQSGGHSGVETFWTNLQYTWDADTGEMHIYLNGVEEPYLSSFDENLSGFDSTHFTDTIDGLMSVGRDPGDSSRFFEGLMDDIGWYNDVLDQTDRDAIRATGVTADPRLVAHWNLDDAPGTTVVAGNSGTNIDLYIQAEPPLPPIQGFGVLAPLNANVTYNAFNNNDLDSNVTLDATNQIGDPLYAYANDPLYVNTPSLETQFTIGFGSSAAYFSSEFAGDTNTTLPHIGAYQNPPTLYPGLFGEGDIEIFGTGEDDLLELTLTGEDTATFVLTRDVGGAGQTVLGTVLLTDITSITFNGLGGDDLLIINQPDNLFFNPSGGITFNGGSQNNNGNSSDPFAATGDTLIINHSMPIEADSVAYVFTPDAIPAEGEDGVITITDASMSDGSTTITFTGLEPILDNLLVADRDFDFTDATETISLSDDATPNDMYSFIDSNLSESVLFLNPTNSITIRTDSMGTPVGVDTVEINTLDSFFDASLTILAGSDDSVTFQSATNLVTGDLFVTASTVNILANIDAASVDISSSGITSTTFNGGTVTTTGSQLYNNAVNFVTNSTLTSSGGAKIEFASTVDGTIDLNIDTAGNTIFGGAVGNTNALTSLTTNTGGLTEINGGIVNTTGNQTFNDDVSLGANAILTSTAIGDITFNETLNGAFTLNVNTDGVTNFIKAVGNSAALMSLTTDASGTTNINGSVVNTTGNQTYNDDVSLGADAVLTSTSVGDITFNETLNGAFTLDVNTAGLTNFNGTVGNSAALMSLTTDADGTTNINGGTVDTTGDQTYHDDVLLGANTILTSTNPGNITFNKTLNGAFTLDVNTAGLTNFNGTVGNSTALVSLTTDAPGTTNINGGTVDTTGDQTYHDDVSLGANTTLTSTDPGNITFNKTLNGAFTLDVNTAGLTNFNGTVGNSAALMSLTTDADGTTNINGGTVDTTGDQTYHDDVLLGINTTLTSTNPGNITFNKTLNGAVTLDVNTAGLTNFNGTVGNSAALMSLTTDADGTTNINGGSVDTTGDQTYHDDVQLGANTTLTSTNPGNITFNKTLNGAFTLDVNTAGLTNFNGTVGNSAALMSLTTDAPGTTNINGGTVDTTGDQTYHDDVQLGASTTLTSTDTGNITFNKTLNGAVTLDVNTAGLTNFNGTVGNSAALMSLTTDAPGTTNINGGTVDTTGDQTYHDDVQLGANTTLTSTNPGNITFNKTLNGAFTLDVNTAGLTNFNGTVGNSAALMSLTTDADGTTNINGGTVDTTGDQTYHDDVLLGTNTTLTSTDPGNITFNKTLNGAFTLDVNTAGLTNFNGTVGNSAALTSLTTDVDGTTNINGGTVDTTGDQTYHDDALLGANTTLTSTNPGNITFNKTLNGAVTLDVNTAGLTNFNGTVGNSTALVSLTTDAPGTTNINGGTVDTTGDQTYHDDVSLGANTTLTSTDPGNITFNKTLNGAFTLDVNTAGLTNFNGTVGNSAALMSLTTDADGTTNINGGTVDTTGDQTYHDDALLGANTTLTSTDPGNITFNKTLNGAFTLDVNTAGLTNFNGTVGNSAALMSLTTDADGTTNINGGTVDTTGDQTYHDDVLLGANTTLTSTNPGNITFNKTLNGAFTLDVNTAGLTNFNGTVGNSAALMSLTTDAPGTTNINGGTVDTTGDQTYHDDALLGANTTLTSTDPGNITFNKTLNGAVTLDVNTAGLTNFNGTVGNSTALMSLTTDAPGTTNINGGTVDTTGDQTYHDDVSLGANTTLTSTDPGNITFNKTLNGAFTLDVNTAGLTNFNGTVGNSAALMSLTTDADGTTNINGGSVDTTGDQTYHDDVLLGANTTLTSTDPGNITFNKTLNGAFTLDVNTAGLTNFNGTVGNSAALMSLTTDADGTTNINGGTVDTTGDQTYHDDVLLGTNTTLTSTDPGNITFNKTLNGAFTLDVNTAGLTNFNGTVGNSTALVILTTDAPGTTNVNGGSVDTTGSQTYHDAVILGMSTNFTSTTMDDITFNSTLTGGSGINVDISATNNIIFNAAVSTDGNVTVTADSDLSGTGDVSMQMGSSLDAGSGTIEIDGANVTTRSVTTTNTTATSVNIDASNGNVTTKDNGVNSRGDISITATGTVTLEDFGINTGDGGGVVIQATGDITSTGTGIDTTLGTMSGGSIGVTSNTGKVDFTNGNVLTGDAGNINVDAVTGFTALNSSFDTTAGTGSGSVEINVSAGSNSITTGGVTVNAAGTILLTARGAASDITISSNLTSIDGSITLLADNDITLSSTTNIVSQASGMITLTADNDNSNAGSITMNSGSTVQSQGGQIRLSAYDNVAVSAISTTGGRVDITSTNGNITDNDITAAKNVTANQLVMNANMGIGKLADAIDTAISFLEADAGLGGFFLDNMGNLTVGNITPQVGIDADLEILVNAMGVLDITEDVQSTTDSVTFTATDELIVNIGTTIATFGTGALLLTTPRNIKLNSGSNLKTVDGGITLLANDTGTTTGDFTGVEAENATIETTGLGNILITGFGGDDGLTSNHDGVHLHTGTTISSTSTGASAGTITINGTGGTGLADNTGVRIENASTNVTSVDGNIQIVGNTTTGDGIQIVDQGVVLSTGTGVNAATITINGTTASDNAGVMINSNVQSTDGNIVITGVSNGAGTASDGVQILNASGQINSSNGNITINGTSNGNDGIQISDSSSITITGTGNIELLGNSTGTGNGIELNTAATLNSNVGTVTVTSEDDVSMGDMVRINSTSGTVTVTADNAAGNNGNPITMADDALIDAGSGDINLTTDGNVLLGGLLTTGTVNIDSLSAAITDNGDTHTDITASTAVLNAVTGIGDGNPLETDISTLSATVSGIGNLFIDNGIDAELLNVSTFDGNITFNATATITATSVVSTNNSASDDNDISLTATGTNSDILVTTITATGIADVILTADDGILDTNDIDMNRITADNLMMTSSSAGGTQDGINVQTDVNTVTAAVNTNPGGLRILEVDDITLTQLTTADGPITVNAGGTIQAIDVISQNSSASELTNGISLTATGATSDIIITSLTAQNTADITLNSGRDILDSDSSDMNITFGDQLTAVAANNIGGISSIFTEAGFDPIQTTVDHMDLTSGNIIAIHNTDTSPELINLDAGTLSAGTTFVKATNGSLDVSLTTGISNSQDDIGLVSDTSITVPTGLQTANLRLDAPNIIDAGGGNIDINAVNAILFNSTSAETVEITAQQFDGTATGSDFVIINDSPALELVDLNTDSNALTGGTNTNVSLTSAGSITVTNLVSTFGTGTLLIDVTDTNGDLILNQNIQSETGSVTISTARDIIFNDSNNLTSTSGNVMLTADSDSIANGTFGGITMSDGSFINAGDGAVTLMATDDITLSQIITTNATDFAIHLETMSSVIDAGDSTGEDLIANEVGARVTIVSATGVGKVADANGAIETQVDQINITNQTSGEIQITETDALIIHDIIQATAGNISVIAGDNIRLSGLIQTITGDVVLDSQASIIDQNDGMPDPLNIHAINLDLNAITGIGVGDTLELSVDNFSADTTNGDILLHNTATTGVTATSITTGTGNIELEQIGNESLSVDLASTDDGNITISNEGDAQTDLLTLTSITAGGTAPEINLSTIGFGNILLGDVSGLTGLISVTSAGNINDAVDDQVSPEVDIDASSGSIILQALNGIGNNEIVELAAGNLTINTTTGNIDVSNLSSSATGPVTVFQVTTGLGTIDFIQTGGQSTTFEEISTTDSDITILADGSMTFENPGILTDVVSTDGTGTIQVTATGVDSSIQINDGFRTIGGTIDLTAEKNLAFGNEGDVSSSDGKITLLADSAARGAGGGGITMSDGTIFNAGTGIVDLQAGDNLTIGQLFTTTLSRLTSTAGGVVDAGDTDGADITADELVIRTAAGAGSTNPLETAVSLLAATNSDSGNIQIHNDLGGGLLTIGTVDGLAGITNAAGVPGDIIISNASPLTVNSPVTNSSGGHIDLESTGPGNLTLNAPVRAFGGHGNINVEAGDGILDFNDTGVASDHSVAGNGIFSGHGTSGVLFDSDMTLNSETGAIADIPPDLRNIFTPQIEATGDATVTGDFGRFTEENFFITIDWGDGTVETTNFSNPGSFVFTHNYVANPNSGNPAAPIPIIVTMQGDMQFTFSDGSGNLDFTTETGFLETPGDGLATVAIDTTPQVPLLIFPPTQTILDATSSQQTVFTSKDTVSIESSINEANKNAERLVFLRILAPNGNVIEDVVIQESDLDNLPKLFKSLPDGRYQLYLKEAGEERIRLLMDVDIRGGKATDVTEDQSAPANQKNPDADNSTTQRQVEESMPLSSRTNLFQEELKTLTTVASTDADTASTPEDLLYSDRILIDGNSAGLLFDQNRVGTKTNQSATELNGLQADHAEKAWSSAALLSGYFHGKSLLKKPVKQDDFDDAMGKYGRRLLNRNYNLFKRNQ